LSRRSINARVALSPVLCALLAFEMFYDLTGDLLHELVAIVFAVLLVVHVILTRKWVAAACRSCLYKKTRKAKNVVRLVVILVILIVVVVLATTSILTSELLEEAGVVFFVPGFDRFTLRIIHTISAYVLCAVVVVHAALDGMGKGKAAKQGAE